MNTLLLVDSDPDVRTTLARSLSGYGFAVIATADGQEAVNVLRSKDVDVLVTELSLPTMDGFALLAYVGEHTPNLPTVVLSAADPALYGERLGEFGPPRVLRKPVGARELADEARGALSRVVRGNVTGLGLPSLLQMLEWERKTCSVQVGSSGREGRLDFLSGELVNAYSYTSGAEGEAAAFEIFMWDDAQLELERLYPTAKRFSRLIHTPLQPLLIDAMRKKDELARRAPAADTAPVGHPEDKVFFRRRRQNAPAAPADPAPPPPAEAAPADARPVPVAAPGTQLERAKAVAPAVTVPSGTGSAAAVMTPVAAESLGNAQTGEGQAELTAHVSGRLKGLLSSLDGALAATLVDYRSGLALGRAGGGVNLEAAAVGNSRVVRAKMKTITELGLDEELEDILITLSSQYHLLHVLPGQELFVYLVLSRKANLARSRYRLKSFVDALEL